MTPRERLSGLLNKRIVDLLQERGFTYNESKSQFTRTANKIIKQIIYFEGSKWNYSDAVADYSLLCRLEIKDYPKWYIGTYQTDQAPHHQCKINHKAIAQPTPSKSYRETWDDYAQTNRKYDLLKYSESEIEENIFKNITNSILPYLDVCSSYSGIAQYSLDPINSFDFYMMDDNKVAAREIFDDLILKIRSLDKSKINFDDDFTKKSIENTILMVNLRVEKFFPEIGVIKLT